ncbi:hypothetical protein [Lactobacillus crispatus]|uniref:hypothetical protein n=1 Tax=Lactobacillus crispatus TaxID=47770 RepID=UPI003369BEB0
MISGEVDFGDHASTDFGMVVQKPWDLIHPTADIDPTHIKGKNGDFLQNNQSYQNVTETFNLEILRPPERGWFDWERSVTDWLSAPTDPDGRMKYQYLKFTADPTYVFKAIVKDPFTVTKDVTSDFVGVCAIPFYCQPFQYRIDGIAYIPLPDSDVVVGEENGLLFLIGTSLQMVVSLCTSMACLTRLRIWKVNFGLMVLLVILMMQMAIYTIHKLIFLTLILLNCGRVRILSLLLLKLALLSLKLNTNQIGGG